MKKTEKASTLIVVLTLFLSLSMVSLHVIKVGAQEVPVVQMSPFPFNVQNASLPFSLNLTIANVTDLYGWQARIYFQNTVMNFVSATEGSFLDSAGSTYFALSPYTTNEFNATYGMVVLGDVLIGNVSGVDGSGTLATLTFQAVGGGSASLHFDLDPESGTFLIDSTIQHIAFTAIDGVVSVLGLHNVAVTNIVPLKTVIGQGYGGNFSVAVNDTGSFNETFNVALIGNNTSIVIQAVTLANGGSANVIFTWNTSAFSTGSYNMSAYAQPVPDEFNLTDNNCTDGVVKVSIPGDLNGDFKVSLSDLQILAKAYGSHCANYDYRGEPASSNWSPNADINNDGKVNLSDLTIMARHYGQSIH